VNRIEEAASLLENGWCTGDLQDPAEPDKHCAVGAVASVCGILSFLPLGYGDNEDNIICVDEDATYAGFNELPEAKALATEVMESEWYADRSEGYRTMLAHAYEAGDYDEVVFRFNDDQKDASTVIEMFKYAAKRM
jgi:hypothetical protein